MYPLRSHTSSPQLLQQIAAVNESNLAPGFKITGSKDKPDADGYSKERIDASFFRDGRVPGDNRPNWAEQVVSLEFKDNKTANDPFDDRTDDKVEADAITRKRVRGQLISYAELVFRYQHRTALYQLLIMGRHFRFIRWDRSGTIVTRAVDYFERPDLLCEMLWHMAQLVDEQLGMDPSAVRIRQGDRDYALMEQVAFPQEEDWEHEERLIDALPGGDQVFRYVRDAFRNSLHETWSWPRYRLDVPDGKEIRQYLVGKPIFHASGMAGRGTRGYVALDCQSRRFVWLKDAWRAHYDLVDQEGSVLENLNKAKVRNVPTLVCHGDILEQSTKTPDYWPTRKDPEVLTTPKPRKRSISEVEDTSEEECPLRRHRHYRLVVQEVAMDLTAFRTGKQLVSIIYDCVTGECTSSCLVSHVLLTGLLAHDEAMTKAKIVHRDVSGGNILIFPKAAHLPNGNMAVKWKGLLADWELSKPVCDDPSRSRARQPERTVCFQTRPIVACFDGHSQGTWQYMSVAALEDHAKVIETSDELESFFHVLLYNAVRHLKSNCPDVGVFIEDFFDTHSIRDDRYVCGSKKSDTMQDHGEIRLIGSKDILLFESPLDGFFSEALKWFKAHYKVQAYQNSLTPPPSPLAPPAPPSPPAKPAQTLSPPSSPQSGAFDDFGERDNGAPVEPLRIGGVAKDVPKPTQKEEDDALKVSNHADMLDLLFRAGKSKWTADHAIGDNVPLTFEPKRPVGPARFAAAFNAPRKRSRIGVPGPKDAQNIVLPATINFPFVYIPPGANPRTPRRDRPDLKPSATDWY